MPKLELSRRSLLRAAAGATVAIALPPLEAMFDSNGERLAHAAPSGPTRRWVTFFMGNGSSTCGPFGSAKNVTELWVPAASGANFALSPSLQPLASVKQYVRVMSGLRAPYPRQNNHPPSFSQGMTGFPLTDKSLWETKRGGPTADYIASKTLGAGMRFPLLSMVAAGIPYNTAAGNALTFKDDGTPVPALRKPIDIFNKLFTGFTPAGGTAQPDPALLHRKSVLDFVREDAARLNGQLSASDRARLDEHLTTIAELEKSLVATGGGAACVKPNAPADTTDYRLMTRQMSDLIALAFACDQTRVISFGPTSMGCSVVLPWISSVTQAHHLSHRLEAVAQGALTASPDDTLKARWLSLWHPYTLWHMQELAYLVQKLAAIKEGAQSILDTTLIVTASEHGNSDYHCINELPHLVVGGPQLVTGNYHWRAPTAPALETDTANSIIDPTGYVSNSKLWLTLLKAVGSPVSSFGGTKETGTLPIK